MNKREFLELVAAGEMDSEVMAYAAAELEKMDAANEKRRAKAAEKNVEKEAAREEIRAAVLEVASEDFKTVPTLIAEAELDVTPQAVAYALRQLVDKGMLVKDKVSVTGKGKHVAYKLA